MKPATYHDCYRTLRIPATQNWEDVRVAYRRRVHACHPDLAPPNEGVDHSGREEEFKQVVKAYRLLAEYRRRNACLPSPQLRVDTDTTACNTGAPPAVRTVAGSQRAGEMPRRYVWLRVPRFHQAMFVAFITGVSAASVASRLDNADAFVQKPGSELSVGMQPRDVVDVQGVPNFTRGSVWFYGESGVVFDGGCVVGWKNAPPFPLRTAVHDNYRRMRDSDARCASPLN